MRGWLITFEGPDGAGKTTQMRLLGARLQAAGREVVYSREPGGTRISEQIREMLLNPMYNEIADRTEALLYAAARAQHVEELIRPSIMAGKIVLCDRFTHSTIAYQGFGRGINIELLNKLNEMAVAGVRPDLTLIFDLNPAEGLNRISDKRSVTSGTGKDRIELEELHFHERVREGFRRLAELDPVGCKLIDAAAAQENVHEAVWQVVKEVFDNENP